MRRRLRVVIAGGFCLSLSPLLGGFLHAQEPAAPRGQALTINRREPPKDSAPAPRGPGGRVLLGGATTGKDQGGLWTPLFGILDPILEYPKVPFQPWARALYQDRQIQELEPHTRCHPSGVARQFMTPYGVEFVEMPELQRVYIMDEGGPHTFRIVYMDGRSHPASLTHSAYGHSIGWWEGDTFVVDTVGYNEKFWLDRRGLPHTDQLHTIERFTRVSNEGMKYETTIDDPGAYTAPWTGWFYMQFTPGQELWEYVCQQSNFAPDLMVGSFDKVDRTTTIVP